VCQFRVVERRYVEIYLYLYMYVYVIYVYNYSNTYVLTLCVCQFRVVERRLLVRYKEKNAAPLNGLDIILADAYKQVLYLLYMCI
jgi:hypothetical protein